MTVDNWKLWLIPFAAWVVVMAWYSGYQSGYVEGHQTAWEMSRPNVSIVDGRLGMQLQSRPLETHFARK